MIWELKINKIKCDLIFQLKKDRKKISENYFSLKIYKNNIRIIILLHESFSHHR